MEKDYVGLTWHCHHDVLLEFCISFKERTEYIKSYKPTSEQEIRLKLFKPVKNVPELFQKAYIKCNKACAEYSKAYIKCNKAWAEYSKVQAEYSKVQAEYSKVQAEWFGFLLSHLSELEEWHRQDCGCKKWNGKEIVF